METPLQVTELDKAVEEGNPRSAPGADGFGMPLIKACWDYLRNPLFNYVGAAQAKGIMTLNFRGASIRLIPKQGDVSTI